MLRIRALQLRIESLYHEDEMKTPVHLCIGQEAVAAGVCLRLSPEDTVSSNHRGHGHYLAKGGDLKGLVAELFCRETGCSRGRGGSMHLVDRAAGLPGSSSIVGGGIPIGTGLALAMLREGKGRVSVVFFGDGAADEGVLYECVNFALLKRLPVLFVYEDNGYSVCSAVAARHPGELPFHAVPRERLGGGTVDGNDAEAVYAAAGEAVERARRGGGPSFLECRTYRMRGHAGSGSDAHLGYRPAGEVEAWEKRDPVLLLRERLEAAGELPPETLRATEGEIAAELDEAFRFARTSPLPRREDLLLHLFAE
jgi:pyruvate dehydrogenase E1 component alpha subunit